MMMRFGKIQASRHSGFLALVVAGSLALPLAAWADDESAQCPANREDRTADQVLSDHVAAILASDPVRVACDYSEEAVVILPGQIAQGPDQIQNLYAYLFNLMGGNISLGLTSKTSAAAYTILLYTVNSTHVSVSDGVDTFVIRHGRIVAQTARLGGLTFK
jgi:ketosteroid isomerase-like protein